MSNIISPPAFLTCQELAVLLHVRPETIRRWARARVIPAIRINHKTIRFDEAAVRRVLVSGKGVTRA